MTQNRQTALLVLAATFALSTPAFSQAPSQAQRDAIKSKCRSDYIAHCSSIPPGGAASLQCLQQNMASLSAACATAVKAVAAPAAAKAEPAPAAAKEEPKETKSEPAPAPAPAAAAPANAAAEPAAKSPAKAAVATPGKPTSAQISAVRANCRSDYPKVCAGVPTGGAAALQCLAKNRAKLSAACGNAVAAAAGGSAEPAATTAAPATANANPAAAPAAATPATAAPAAAPALVLRPLRPREVLFVMRSACGADVRALCAGVPAGGGRIIECLASQAAKLSPACRNVLGQFAAR
ncbi:MAG TPA: hypothetical protein VKR55_12760 [Bradyrhizobium sp.]|nr:hypothetical protein [Bradyrhizobium sp.]HLZ03011.1 hypothetical protein [Bradyrhizobium sp.]